MGFLGGAESAIEYLQTAVCVRFVAIRPVGRKCRIDSFDIIRRRRLAFEVPSSKLDTHGVLLQSAFALDPFLTTQLCAEAFNGSSDLGVPRLTHRKARRFLSQSSIHSARINVTVEVSLP